MPNTPLHNERLGDSVTGALDGSVDRGSLDAEEFSDLRGGVFTALVDLDQVLLLRCGQFGLLAAQSTGRFGDLHPFASACSDQVGLEFSDHREHVEEESSDWVGWVVNGTADTELHFTAGEVVDDVFGIAKRACQAVELGYYEGVAGSACG